MEDACGLTPKVRQPFHAPRIQSDAYLEDVEQFVHRLSLD
jgi:hypothetical protein